MRRGTGGSRLGPRRGDAGPNAAIGGRIHRAVMLTARAVIASLIASAGLVVVSPPVLARTVPQYPEAKGLGTVPEHSITGDCRDPTPDPNAQCINTPWNGHISISPHVVTACKRQGGQLVGSCRITATIDPNKFTVVWGSPSKPSLAGFGNCGGGGFKQDSDVPGGWRGGPSSCYEDFTSPTNGWVVASQDIAGPCASVHAFQQGSGEFATCTTASGATAASDYYAVLPADTGVIMGHVYEKDGTTPIRGTAVQIRSSDDKRSVANTDATGFYSAYVDTGSYTICPCWFQSNEFNQGQADAFTPRNPTLSVNGPVTQDFVEGGWQISGQFTRKVTHKGDPPLAGIAVGVTGQDGYYRETQTDANGHYTITVPDGSYAIEGLTPPPLQNSEFVDGVPYQCVHNGAASPTAQCVLSVSADDPHVDFVFNDEYKLALTESAGPSLPGQNVKTITAQVTDYRGDPVAGAKVHFAASAPAGAAVALSALSGGGALFNTFGQSAAASLVQSSFDLTTDWSGEVQLAKWFGLDAALSLDAAIDGSAGPSNASGETAQLQDSGSSSSTGPPLSSSLPQTLNRGILARNRARPAPHSPLAALQFVVVDALNDLSSTGGAAWLPVTSHDGSTGGIVVFPEHTDVNAIVAYLQQSTAAPPPAVEGAQVIDMGAVANVVNDPTSQDVLPASFQPLSAWATANPGMAPGMMDGSDGGGIGSGLLYRQGIRPPAVADRLANEGVLGIHENGLMVVTSGPLALTATLQSGTDAGQAAGLGPGGQVVTGIPWAEVLDYSRMGTQLRSGFGASARGKGVAAYLLPQGLGDYAFQLTGTGSGPATVSFYDENRSPIASYSLQASQGEEGTIATQNGSLASTLRFGTQAYQSGDGPSLRLLGAPASLVPGTKQELQLRVVDAQGLAVAGAKVHVDGTAPFSTAYAADGWTAADGSVDLPVEVPEASVHTGSPQAGSAALPAYPPTRNGYTMAITASAPGYASAKASPKTQAVAPGGTAQARAAVAVAPGPPSPWGRMFTDPSLLAGLIAVALLTVVGIGIVRFRWSVVGDTRL